MNLTPQNKASKMIRVACYDGAIEGQRTYAAVSPVGGGGRGPDEEAATPGILTSTLQKLTIQEESVASSSSTLPTTVETSTSINDICNEQSSCSFYCSEQALSQRSNLQDILSCAIQQACSSTGVGNEQQDVCIRPHYDEKLPEWIQTDGEKLHQALTIALTRAKKMMPQRDGAVVDLSVSISERRMALRHNSSSVATSETQASSTSCLVAIDSPIRSLHESASERILLEGGGAGLVPHIPNMIGTAEDSDGMSISTGSCSEKSNFVPHPIRLDRMPATLRPALKDSKSIVQALLAAAAKPKEREESQRVLRFVVEAPVNEMFKQQEFMNESDVRMEALVRLLGGSVHSGSSASRMRLSFDIVMQDEPFLLEPAAVTLRDCTILIVHKFGDEAVDHIKQVFGRCQIEFATFPNMNMMAVASTRQRFLSRLRPNICLVDEDLYSERAHQVFSDSVQRNALITFGPRRVNRNGGHHITSLRGCLLSVLVRTMATAISHAQERRQKDTMDCSF